MDLPASGAQAGPRAWEGEPGRGGHGGGSLAALGPGPGSGPWASLHAAKSEHQASEGRKQDQAVSKASP